MARKQRNNNDTNLQIGYRFTNLLNLFVAFVGIRRYVTMSILESINNDFQQAFKKREEIAISTLRMILAATKNERIKKMADLDDEDVIKVLKSEIKKRKEAISDYEKGNRNDLAEKEKEEIRIIEKYLPTQMSEDEIRNKVKEILAKLEEKENLGKIIGLVMKELKGQADGNLVRKIVEEELGK